jgi:AcrR family transcriptional regulator
MSEAAIQEPTTQARILEAAYDVFSERGFEGASVRAVCKHAGVNVAAINYHWSSKEALWLAVCKRAVGDLWSVVLPHLQPVPIGVLLPKLIGDLFDTLARDPRPARILTWVSLEPKAVTEVPGVDEGLHHVIPIGMAYFEDLKKRGKIADVDVELVVIGLYAQLLSPFVGDLGHRSYFGKGIDDPEHAQRVRRAIIAHTMTLLGLPTP